MSVSKVTVILLNCWMFAIGRVVSGRASIFFFFNSPYKRNHLTSISLLITERITMHSTTAIYAALYHCPLLHCNLPLQSIAAIYRCTLPLPFTALQSTTSRYHCTRPLLSTSTLLVHYLYFTMNLHLYHHNHHHHNINKPSAQAAGGDPS